MVASSVPLHSRPAREFAVLLTCPTCRSGLQVPDGTTAHVRCPACRTVFGPSDVTAPAPAPPPPPAVPRRPAPPRAYDEDDAPRRRRRREPVRERVREPEPSYDRDGDEELPRPRKRPRPDDDLTDQERRARDAGFQRAMWGCKLVALSFLLYCLSMLLICLFFIRTALANDINPALLTAAGALGLINWIVGAVGVGLCLSGYASPGHWRFGITAAVLVVVHAIFLAAVMNRGEMAAEFMRNQGAPTSDTGSLAQLPTKLDAVTLYMVWLVYPDQMHAPNSTVVLSVLTGVAEMLRLAAVMLLLSCLARAAGDEDLVHKCVRSAGIVCFIPGVLALGVLALAAFIFETSAQGTTFAGIAGYLMVMGVYAVFAGMVVPPLMAARDAADACEYPFEAQRVVIGA